MIIYRLKMRLSVNQVSPAQRHWLWHVSRSEEVSRIESRLESLAINKESTFRVLASIYETG